MIITRKQIIEDLSMRCGFYKKDIKILLNEIDDLIKEYYSMATLEDEIRIKLIEGLVLGCKIIEERERVNPQDRSPVICPEAPIPIAKYTQDFKDKLFEKYDNQK